MKKQYADLQHAARHAKKHSYSPYSKFRVGAALLTTSGKIYSGCNVEISTYALTICAERNAIFKAISEGDRNFKAIAVVSDDPAFTPPCGACRQVLMDLAGNIDFIMIDGKGKTKIVKLRSLLPHAFTPKNLQRSSRNKKK